MTNQKAFDGFLLLGCNRYWHPKIKTSLVRCFPKYENQEQYKLKISFGRFFLKYEYQKRYKLKISFGVCQKQLKLW